MEQSIPETVKNELKNFGIIILAAGQGKRLNCTDLPKVLFKIGNRPIVSYILAELERSGVAKKQICLVVGFKAELVKETIGSDYFYAEQKELLGTAHAALAGAKALPENFSNFLVLNGDDSAFYRFESLYEFIKNHLEGDYDASILTCEPDDPQGLGRVARGQGGKIVKIVEKENMTPDLELIREINTGTFCFKRSWFNEHYANLKPFSAAKGEYGLPSFVEEALCTGSKLGSIKLKRADEWFGINTSEQLKEADKRKF